MKGILEILINHLCKLYKLGVDEFTLNFSVKEFKDGLIVQGKFRVYSQGSRVFTMRLDNLGKILDYWDNEVEEPFT
ncbi:hypothetical protein HRbin06_00101 [archaeon HR06]|nr:hypothetical protein HRbin06_00101 [archaeon HR06]